MKVDRTTGAATIVGDSGFTEVAALAIAADGTIYASVPTVATADSLATVDPVTGAATVVGGPYGLGIGGMVALAFDPGGALHGVTNDVFGGPALYTIDRATGLATFVGMIEEDPGVLLSSSVRGLAFSGDGTLFATTEYPLSSYFAFPASAVNGSDLLMLDPATGRVLSVVGNAGFTVEALAFCGDGGGPSVFAVLPERAGNAGAVDALVYHDLTFGGGASVKLTRSGEPDIVGSAVLVEAALHRIRATFDLTGAVPGVRDVVVTDDADPGNSGVLANGFTIVDGSIAVLRIVPGAGGDGGTVTAIVEARNVAADATVKLVRGAEEIAGSRVVVAPGSPLFFDPGTVTATFDLTGKTLGAWDVVVTNPGDPGSPGVLPGAFAIESGAPPDVSFGLAGPDGVRVGIPTRYVLTARNAGNVDTTAVLGVFGVPEDAVWSVEVPATLFGGVTPNAQKVQTPGGPAILLPVILLPPGVQRTATLTLEAASEGDFQLRAILVRQP